jgi:putative ABC transport system permease protein
LIGASAGVASIVLAIVFVSNLNTLLHTPERFGWTWNRMLQTDQTVNSKTITDVGTHLGASSDVAGWADIVPATLTVNGHSVPGIGLRPGTNQLLPTMARGRVPTGLGEIALGGRTLHALHLHLGDTVNVGVAGSTDTQAQTIVGQVVLPTLGVPGADNTELGVGGVVRIPGGPLSLAALDPLTRLPTSIAMDFPKGAPPPVVATALGPYAERVTSGQWTMLSRTQRPSDIVGLNQVNTAPLVLAGVMAAVIIGAIVFALFGSLRSRHRELAVLKSLGFVRRQLGSVVVWEATTLSVIACAAGLLVGIAAGRWAWMLFSDSLGIARFTELPIGLLIATAAVTLVVGNVAAIVPARRAARTPAAAILRGE